ncbi:MAG: hypothetical protein LUC88_03640 [Prevotella sp.]|nr:hypothetical protein [Prevotella sp.]
MKNRNVTLLPTAEHLQQWRETRLNGNGAYSGNITISTLLAQQKDPKKFLVANADKQSKDAFKKLGNLFKKAITHNILYLLPNIVRGLLPDGMTIDQLCNRIGLLPLQDADRDEHLSRLAGILVNGN